MTILESHEIAGVALLQADDGTTEAGRGVLDVDVVLAAGLAVAGTVPVVIEVATVLNPLILLLVVGLIGAAAALRRVITVDPMNALAGAR